MASGFDVKDQELRGLVTVQLVEAVFKSGQLGGAGLEQQKSFTGGFDLALPVVDGLNSGDESGARGEALFDQCAGNSVSLLRGRRGGEDDSGGRGGFGHEIASNETSTLNPMYSETPA